MANIKVFARLKPCQNINQELFKREDQTLYISTRGQVETNAISSRVAEESKCLRFRFSHVFGMDSSQKNVFEVAAKDIVEEFLEGYNGTIFAYGQTGAGKTYTIQGPEGDQEDSRDASENEGLIPRSLSLIFHKLQHNQHDTINLHVSFLEIYRETAYDLLGPLLFKGSRKFKELPKVLITMGGKGACHFHGLSCHHVTSEKDAVRLYHLGLANRNTAETTANQRSSRSHTIFTIALTRQRHGAEIFVRSKLHLVDLAGSERVWKSSGVEQQLSEAKFINLSLHHLESVVIALQKFSIRNFRNHSRKKQTAKKTLNRSSSAILSGTKNMDVVKMPRMKALLKNSSAVELGNRKGRHSSVVIENESVHVPYRNSLLTMVLQDSLGGNCKTAMIAALSLEEKNFCESITTCRFAQRVARIINKPLQNEEVDKDLVIKRLQTTLAKLYLELANYKVSEQESEMACREDENSLEHEQECVDVMDSFLHGRINDPVAHGVNTPRKFRTTLRYLRRMFVQSNSHLVMSGDDGLESADDRDSGVRTNSEPTSPLVSEGENDHAHFGASYDVAELPSNVSMIANVSDHRSSITQESGISLNTEHEEATPDPDISLSSPSSELLQSCGPETNEASTQTTVLTTSEEGKRKIDACAEEERVQPVVHSPADLWIWELELQKETLLNRSKMFTSRLTDQRARLIVMAKQGAVPEELENEKIVELQLQKKQCEVENKLSLVIKKLADLKYTDQLQQSVVCIEKQATGSKEDWPLTCTARSNQVKDLTQTSKELELKEASTRQKLLDRRERMRNFGFSTPTMHHGISCQSPASVSGFRSGTRQAGFSTTPTLTLHWEDHGRERGVRCSPTPPLGTRDIVVQPPRLKTRISDNSLQINNTVPNSRNAALRRTFSNQERLSRSTKCTTSRSEGKRSPLSEYIINSRKAVYQNSTFPRQIANGVRSDLSGLESAPRKMPKKQVYASLSRSSGSGGLRLNEELSAKEECGLANLTEERDMRNARTENQGELSQESKCSSYDLFSGEEATSKSREHVYSHDSPSLICLKNEQNERVKKIRECVNAAEVIQRTWRLYKKNECSESSR